MVEERKFVVAFGRDCQLTGPQIEAAMDAVRLMVAPATVTEFKGEPSRIFPEIERIKDELRHIPPVLNPDDPVLAELLLTKSIAIQYVISGEGKFGLLFRNMGTGELIDNVVTQRLNESQIMKVINENPSAYARTNPAWTLIALFGCCPLRWVFLPFFSGKCRLMNLTKDTQTEIFQNLSAYKNFFDNYGSERLDGKIGILVPPDQE